MNPSLILPVIFISAALNAQKAMEDTLPYAEIPEAPENYTPGTVISRMLDGLGFRYYWATEGLAKKELEYRPENGGRTIAETMDHVHDLSLTILSSGEKRVRNSSGEQANMNNNEKRRATLENLAKASSLFRTTTDLSEHKLIFKRAGNTSQFPFWNNINGPIEDAIWHAGQIATLRRLAGNPINPKVNVFLGRLND